MDRTSEETYHVPPYQLVSSSDVHVLKSRIDQLIKEGYVLYSGHNVVMDDKGQPYFSQAMVLPHVKSADQHISVSSFMNAYNAIETNLGA